MNHTNFIIRVLENERFESNNMPLIVSSFAIFGILYHHFRGRIAGVWISLLFQILVSYTFVTGTRFARMTNLDTIHGLAVGYYIGSLLFPYNTLSVIHHVLTLIGLFANCYFVCNYQKDGVGLVNSPIVFLAVIKCGDMYADIVQIMKIYNVADDVVNLACIFEIATGIYTRFYLTNIMFVAAYSKIYTVLALCIYAMGVYWTVVQILILRKRLFSPV